MNEANSFIWIKVLTETLVTLQKRPSHHTQQCTVVPTFYQPLGTFGPVWTPQLYGEGAPSKMIEMGSVGLGCFIPQCLWSAEAECSLFKGSDNRKKRANGPMPNFTSNIPCSCQFV